MEDNLEIYSDIKLLFDDYLSNRFSELSIQHNEMDKRPDDDSYTDFLSPLESSVGIPTFENISPSNSISPKSNNEEDFDGNEHQQQNEYEYGYEPNGEAEEQYYLDSDSDKETENTKKEYISTKYRLITKNCHISDVIINVINKKKKFESHDYIYYIIKLLGYGYYGTVFLAKMKAKEQTNQNYQLVAIKIINFEQMKTNNYNHSENHNTIVDIIDQLNDEINILITMKNHKNVVNYIESFYINPHYLAFVTDYISGYTLRDIYKSYGPFSENLICFISEQILKVLSILNNYNYRYKRIHKDIKSNNIMIDYNTCQIKLLDFGVSQILDSILYHTPKISSGTLQWMSPELIQSKDYNHLTDIWSLGITLLELSTGHIPNIYEIFLSSDNLSSYTDFDNKSKKEGTLERYIKLLTQENESYIHSNLSPTSDKTQINQNQTYGQIIQRNNSIINKIKSFSNNYSDFLNNMLIINPNERPDSSKLLEHPFIASKRKSTNIFHNNFQNIEKELYHYNNSFNITDFFKQKILSKIFPNISIHLHSNNLNHLNEEALYSNSSYKQNKSIETINFNYIQNVNEYYDNENSSIQFSLSDSDTSNNNS
ncbi:protein kinase [Cryptosporidium ubiquitum]|uniref:non-specific serine/threonine protein kinase n=1 Tax=Cryptosporidium ubiquitum TaxID=857276 RepID=A0A1J4MI34_9CRYT|nr:protein kinase [Cryptosporidium ubiquitum]OII72684.1 protein kinase [Cryptosporidium ubiquitum]